jgi:hypothetical protein
MIWDLPVAVEIDGKEYAIRNKCDYRVVLDVIEALTDDELEMENRVQCALFIFYEDLSGCEDLKKATSEMIKIINYDEQSNEVEDNKPPIMSWQHDFPHIAPPISRVLGYSVRDTNHYTHWFDFMGAYHEIGDCFWARVISIRSKRMRGKKLEDWEQEFYRENKKIIDLPHKLTDEEQEWLDSDW